MLYDVFVNNQHVGQIRSEVGSECHLPSSNVTFHLVMDLIEEEGNKKVYQIRE